MSLKRAFALAVLVPVLAPSVQGLGALTEAAAHGCAQGVCVCGHSRAHSTAAKPAGDQPAAAPGHCHEGHRVPAPTCGMSARCNHEAPAVPGLTTFVVAASSSRPAPDATPADVGIAPPGAPLAGHSRLDSPPPRRA
jgi:hypothetical protein